MLIHIYRSIIRPQFTNNQLYNRQISTFLNDSTSPPCLPVSPVLSLPMRINAQNFAIVLNSLIMHIPGHHRTAVLIALFIFILAEICWSWKNDKKVYQVKDTITNLLILAGFQLSKLLFAGYQLAIMGLATSITPFHLPHTWWTFGITFIVADFLYYWFHRISHIWKPLWAFHLIHHSSPLMNLTAAYRLNWFGALISPLFFVPAALIGLPADFIIISYALNLLYQFFLHTEVIGKLGAIEGIIDTPSAHRVHHGSNPLYIDKNFGGVFMLWDRIFNTYQPETEKVKYGLTTGFTSNRPLVLVFHGFRQWFRKPGQYKSSGISASVE
jgi:sterol desaturase/sphingolipid hydroxylase (fatty acid hydroxylase superfamily)